MKITCFQLKNFLTVNLHLQQNAYYYTNFLRSQQVLS